MRRIEYAGPDITEDDADYVRKAVLDGFYSGYKKYAEQLERELCELVGVKYAVAVNSATAALHLALVSQGIGNGDEVLMPDSTCVAPAMAVLHSGARPKFVDVSERDLCLDTQQLESAVTQATKAIIAVHWNGHACDMDSIKDFASEHKLLVIEDAAAALGSTYQGRFVGGIGDAGCFSFQGAKIAVGGQGGALVTNDESIFSKARQLAAYGRTDSIKQYWSDFIGWNYLMPSLPAALAVSQIRKLDKLLEKKKATFLSYHKMLSGGSDFLRLIDCMPYCESNYSYPTVLLQPSFADKRDALLRYLQTMGIDARPVQPSVSAMPMFDVADNPVSRIVETSGLILPSAHNIESHDIEYVCREVFRFF